MGCCTSRPASPSASRHEPNARSAAPETTTVADSSPAAIIGAPRRSASRIPSAQHATSTPASTSTRPNKPLRAPSPVPRCPPERALSPWSRGQLAREREAFFDTRVAGAPAAWEALRVVCEMLRAGNVGGAQGMLDAVGLTCPTGRVKHERAAERGRKGGVYDDKGVRYDIPGWVVADPADVVEDEVPEKEALDGADEEEEEEEDGEEEEETRERRRDEKGKGRAGEVGEVVRVTARLSDRGSDVVVDVGKEQRVRVLVQRVQEMANTTARLRLAYMGRMLAEDKTLAAQGWKEGHVLNALVFE